MARVHDRQIWTKLRKPALDILDNGAEASLSGGVTARVTLNAPGEYRYASTRGDAGKDSFTLRLCDTKDGGLEGCANLLFNVNVVN
jgi:hypothetical protein